MATEPIGSPQTRGSVGPAEKGGGKRRAATLGRGSAPQPYNAGDEPRKASQQPTRRGAPVPTTIELSWRPGDKIHWRGYTRASLRDAVGGQAEVLIGTPTYLVWKIKLQAT